MQSPETASRMPKTQRGDEIALLMQKRPVRHSMKSTRLRPVSCQTHGAPRPDLRRAFFPKQKAM